MNNPAPGSRIRSITAFRKGRGAMSDVVHGIANVDPVIQQPVPAGD